ncbi:futalosine hydrolase [Streptomyces sparsogenes]|uniref:futalosine hydrolase n=1 Tax=Streptomyces sparsogenes TaxID=67365 RepID=UPI0033EB5D08
MRVLVVTAVPAERDAVVRGVRAAAAESADTPEAAEVSVPGGRTLHRVVRPPLTVDALAAGVGPAAAAAATATALTAAELGTAGPGTVRPGTAGPGTARLDAAGPGTARLDAAGPGTARLDAARLDAAPYGLVVSAGIGGGFTPAPLGTVVVAEAIVAADLGAETPDGFAAVTDLGFGTVEHLPPPALVRAVAEAAGAVRGAVLTVSTVTGSAGRATELLRRHPRAAAEAMEGFGVAEAAAAHGVPVLEVRAISNTVGPRDRAAWRIGEALDALAGAFRDLPPALATWKGPST